MRSAPLGAQGVAMGGRPAGVVSFLFTDIEGSTRKWDADSPAMSQSLSRHDAILRACIEGRGGSVFKTVGDAFCAAFSSPEDALLAAADAQKALAEETWQVEGGIHVRMAIHTGEAEERDEDYFGPALNRVARLLSLAYGDQLLVSLATEELLVDRLPEGFGLRLLGRFRLKDLSRAETVYQAVGPALRQDFPALKSLDGRPHNLPLQPTKFIGRDAEITAIGKALGEGGYRLLTILGPGGVGKTRLSVQAGAELLETYDGGVWFIDLSDCRNEDATVRAVNRALSIKERPGMGPFEVLKEGLGSRSILLILDNLEQDTGAGAFVGELLGACPGVSLIATSREALRLRWERQFPLTPLAVPSASAKTAASLSQFEAVGLFIERAKAARPSFTVDDRNAPAIAQICVHLEGIPLAIELAAARAGAFSPDDILRRLEADLDFLDSARPDLPDRQRTLRAVSVWSYNLLPKAEKAAFRALGAFAASFSLDSAEALLSAADLGPAALKKLPDLMASLVDKSLVVAEEGERGFSYRLLETLRVYARERLDFSEEAAAVWKAYTGRYLLLARRASSPAEAGWGEEEALAAVGAEYHDYLAAFYRLLDEGDAAALEIAVGLSRYHSVRGLLEIGVSLLERALALPAAASLEPGARAAGRLALAELRRRRGDYRPSLEDYRQAEALAEEASDGDLLVRARIGGGWSHFRLGEMDEARRAWPADLKTAGGGGTWKREPGRLCGAMADEGQGLLALVEGRYPEADRLLSSAAAEYKSLGERTREQVAIGNVGVACFRSGDLTRACEAWRRAAEVAEALGSREDRLVAMNNLACALQSSGDHEGAVSAFHDMEGEARQGNPSELFMVLSGLVESLVALGSVDEAERRAAECVGLAKLDADRLHQSWAERIMAEVLCARGKHEDASACLDRADCHARACGDAFELEQIAALRLKNDGAL